MNIRDTKALLLIALIAVLLSVFIVKSTHSNGLESAGLRADELANILDSQRERNRYYLITKCSNSELEGKRVTLVSIKDGIYTLKDRDFKRIYHSGEITLEEQTLTKKEVEQRKEDDLRVLDMIGQLEN